MRGEEIDRGMKGTIEWGAWRIWRRIREYDHKWWGWVDFEC